MHKKIYILRTCFERLVIISIIPVLCALAALTLKIAHLQLNVTASMPIGIYHRISSFAIHRGNIVAVCLPNDIAEEGLQYRYLTKGKCANGAIPVVKELIAVPHDTVELTGEGFIVNGRFYQAPQHELDSKGRRIKYFVDVGIYANINNYWLYGFHAPDESWDSCYFGGVARENIIHTAQPLWIFD